MRHFLLLLAALLLPAASTLALPAEVSDPPGERPNIVWISAEDLSPRMGAYGDPVARTPNIDRLADEGMLFTQAFTTAGVCAPSRSSIITGMYQNSIGTQHMRTRIHEVPGLPASYEAVPPPYVKAFTEYLRAAGYFATNNVKTDYQFGQPFTVWDESSRQAHWRSEKRAEGQPFFSVFNFTTTHESRVWAASNEGETLATDPDAVEVPPYYPDTPAVREALARHYDNIAEMDQQVGEILRQLEEDGLADNTIVFFWGDHGDGLPRAKRWLYDSGLQVPLVIRWPGNLKPGSVHDELVSFVDLAPTVLSMAGVPVPVHMQGQVFLGEEAAAPRSYIYAARDRFDESYDMVRAVRDKRFKYIRNYYSSQPYALHIPYRNRSAIMQELFRLDIAGELTEEAAHWMSDVRPPEELYDLSADPHEVHNLAEDPAYRDVLDRMRSAMDDWMDEIDDMGDLPETEMRRNMWPDGTQPETAAPIIVPRPLTDTPVESSFTLSGPTDVLIYCPTQGASVAYTTDQGDDPSWQLYTGPVRVEKPVTLRAKAVRYGYKESDETRVSFEQSAP